jgi:hypothetical protein
MCCLMVRILVVANIHFLALRVRIVQFIAPLVVILVIALPFRPKTQHISSLKILQIIQNWSEVWALLIPLTIIFIKKPAGKGVPWLVSYIIFAIIINFFAQFVLEFYTLLPTGLRVGNNLFYNLHSLARVSLLGAYIISLRNYKYAIFMKLLLGCYILYAILNFILWESPLLLSSYFYSVGSSVLLIFCFIYFIQSISDEEQTNWLKHPSFIICTGIAVYEAITFFIFLFLFPLFDKDPGFAAIAMRIYLGCFLLFCILLAIGLYKYRAKAVK